MQIREMRETDLPAVATLSSQLGYPLSEADLCERFAKVFGRIADKLFVAADAADQVVGWIHLQIQADLLTEAKGEVRALVVDSAQRGQGVGKSLLEAGEAWVRDQGVNKVFLRTNIAREAAHRFYQRENFAITKTAHMFVKELRAEI